MAAPKRAGMSVALALAALAAVASAGLRVEADGQVTPARPAAPASQLPSFKTGVDIVSLTVTVSDGAGRYVTDLSQEQFAVFEDGVRQDVTYFARSNQPNAL